MSSPHPSFESKAFESFWATPAGSGLNALSARELTLRVCCWRQWHTGFHAVNGSWKEPRWDNTPGPEHTFTISSNSEVTFAKVSSLPSSRWRIFQLQIEPKANCFITGLWSPWVPYRWEPTLRRPVGLAQGDLGGGPLGAFKRVTCAIWFRIQLGRPEWKEVDPKATVVQTAWGHLLQLLQALGVFRERGSWVPEAEAGLPKSDGVCFIPSTSFPNVYMMWVI